MAWSERQAVKLLSVLLLYAEDRATMHTEALLTAYYHAVRDDEPDIRALVSTASSGLIAGFRLTHCWIQTAADTHTHAYECPACSCHLGSVLVRSLSVHS